MELEIDIQRATGNPGVPRDALFRAWAVAALAGRAGDCSLAIRVVDEDEARRYNREYRGKDCPTNVLSFPSQLPDGLPAQFYASQLGDLLICAPVVAREASEQRIAEADHWAHLVVHGVLHLLGHDHQEENEAAAMETLEAEILAGLGISDPYRDEV